MIVGEVVRIKGERGTYIVRGEEENPVTGARWVVLWGGPYGHWRHVRPERIKRASRASRRGEQR